MRFGLSVQRLLAKSGYTVVKTKNRYFNDGLFTVHSDDFRRDPAFRDAYLRGIKASDGIDPKFEWRVHVALWAAATAVRAPGDFVECGVNAGFISSAIMRYCNWDKTEKWFYLIDTFSGPVLSQYSESEVAAGRQNIAEDALSRGAYVTDVEKVRANFSEWSNVSVVQGAVPDILRDQRFESVAFLHLDMNCAMPERAALEFFLPRMSAGGMILLDDYTYLGHDEQRIAIDGVARAYKTSVLALPTGQGLIAIR